MNRTSLNHYDFLQSFFQLSAANILSNLMVPIAGLINLAFLGHLSELHYVAGAAQAIIFFDFAYYVATFLRQSTTGVTAQAVGRDDSEAMLLVGLRNGLIALGLGILILILQYPLRELWFALVSSDPIAKASGVDYFDARIWGAPAFVLNLVLMGWLLGRSESNEVLLLSVFGNAACIALAYLFIIQWGWSTTGAGLSEAVSQYLMLLGGLIFLCQKIKWKDLRTVFPQLKDLSAFKATFALNGNIFISTLILVSSLSLFSVLSTTMETLTFTQDALMLQLVYLGLYLFEGLGFATETLSGNFKGQGVYEKLAPLVKISTLISLLVGLTFASVSVLFSQTVFGLLTNHTELTENIDVYAWWLLFVLGFSSVTFLLEGYFLGLAEGRTLRNMSFVSILVGYLPVAGVALQFHSNHLLWLSLSMFMATKMVALGIQLPGTFREGSKEPSASQNIAANN